MGNFPLTIVCNHLGFNSTKDRMKTGSDGSYAINFLEEECGIGNEISIRGYQKTVGGEATGIMGKNGICLNMVVGNSLI